MDLNLRKSLEIFEWRNPLAILLHLYLANGKMIFSNINVMQVKWCGSSVEAETKKLRTANKVDRANLKAANTRSRVDEVQRSRKVSVEMKFIKFSEWL